MTRSPEGAPSSSLAARISTVADGHAGTLDLTALRLQLIDEALARGLTWAQLGTLYGMTGPELKRNIHKLRAKVRQEQHAQAELGSGHERRRDPDRRVHR